MKTTIIKLMVTVVLLAGFGIADVNAQYTGTGSNSNSEYVEGYTKDDGTRIDGYYRTESNSYNLDNYNAEGNVNPYSGEVGDRTYESPYNSSYDGGGDFSINYNNSSYNIDNSYNRESIYDDTY